MLISYFLRWKENKPMLLLIIGFIISRIIIRLSGVVFYGEFVKRLWQAIDIELLKTSLLQSLYYSHAQPPLFNLLSGAVLKIFPSHYSIVFHILFLVIGLLNCLLIYLSLRKFKLSIAISLVISLGFMMIPSVILYENLYSYTYINLFLLTLCIYLLLNFAYNQNLFYWALFTTSLCALVLLRSFYHFTWLVIILAIILFLFRKQDLLLRKLIITSILPMLFVLGWLLKNWIVFGSFTTSTWMGMNLARIMPPSTEIGTIGPFKPIHFYTDIQPSADYPAVRLLHQEYKTNSGFVNYYHIDYIKLSDRFEHQVMQEIQSDPIRYFRQVGKAFIIYFSPASHAPFIDSNYRHIRKYASIADLDLTGYKKFKKENFVWQQALPVGLLHLILFAGLIYCFKRKLFCKEDSIVILVMIIMLCYAMIVGNFFEFGENNRFRFEQLTIFIILFAKMSDAILRDGTSARSRIVSFF